VKEKRIYAVVAETVQTSEMGTVIQTPGRMAAQACHAVSRMKMHRMITETPKVAKKQSLTHEIAMRYVANEEITTIILSCRDSRELHHIHRLLSNARIEHYDFEDINPPVYGAGRVRTALATVPLYPERLEDITDYLPLWTPK
jgi:peptidyl-tRNA hydrolase